MTPFTMMSLSRHALPSPSNRIDPLFPFSLGLSRMVRPSLKTFLSKVSVRKDDFCCMALPERALRTGCTNLPETLLETTILYFPPLTLT